MLDKANKKYFKDQFLKKMKRIRMLYFVNEKLYSIFALRNSSFTSKMLSRKVERLDSMKPWQPFGNEEGAKFYLLLQER